MTVSMVGWCSQCQQRDLLLDPALHVMLANTPATETKYRQVGIAQRTLSMSVFLGIHALMSELGDIQGTTCVCILQKLHTCVLQLSTQGQISYKLSILPLRIMLHTNSSLIRCTTNTWVAKKIDNSQDIWNRDFQFRITLFSMLTRGVRGA